MEDNSQNKNRRSSFRGLGGKPFITIEYCPKCGWMLRASYMAQELLTTFTDDIKAVLLQPSEINGRYTIRINDLEIFDRKRAGRFPEIKELKQLVRDVVNPGKSLGHSDKKD
ncbi:SelT/selW/selH selenoprotein [Mucilaginibacter sp. PPCGB 2223]|uniref:SelT/SelW/SelH family protein n=1 Tax=Mucilaginibacter sp. PPCGB 2223 TaxID=1886027 RepID=UPI000825816B|nr:SelT/SelW/SelH family protein [Mucilaginibacter sp. PPCGB 2223]OCX53325.1 SelT/selW/selH selenoprotein [Mucilaginibacter sp. PPCGB 2223]